MNNYSRQVLVIQTNKTKDEIINVLNENLKNYRFVKSNYKGEEVLLVSDDFSKLFSGVDTYLKIYVKDGYISLMCWASDRKKEYSLGNGVNLSTYTPPKTRYEYLAKVLYTVYEMFGSDNSNIISSETNSNELSGYGELFFPNLENRVVNNSIKKEIFLIILSAVAFFFGFPIVLAAGLSLTAMVTIYKSGFYKDFNVSKKIAYIISIILFLIYISVFLSATIINIWSK